MRSEPQFGQRAGDQIYEFPVTEAEVGALVDQVIGRCYETEMPQYVEVYDAVQPFKHEGIMDISLYCECRPEFRFILAFTQEFAAAGEAIVERGDWNFLVFNHPTSRIGWILYRMLRSQVDEATPFRATSHDDPDRVAWLAEILFP